MIDITERSKKFFKPFKEIRTGVQIDTPEQDIAECYRITHEAPKETAMVRTVYGVWLHGTCPHCKYPVDSWAHPNNCGHCGVNIDWPAIQKEVEEKQ